MTRCPLALQLKSHNTPGYWNGVIKYKYEYEEYGECEEYEEYKEYDFEDIVVEKTIEGPTKVDAEVREGKFCLDMVLYNL